MINRKESPHRARNGLVRRGEIWWGGPGLPGGARKRRPFLIVSNNAFNLNEKWHKVMVVHLTTVAGAAAVSWQIPVPRGVAGLPQTSTVKCAEVYTVFKTDLASLVGTLPSEYMSRVDAALQITLSIGP